MPDRSLFLPATLTDPSRPYPRITATRDGSYWNLVMPYAFASGFFPPGGGEAKGILRYLSLHGSRSRRDARRRAHRLRPANIVGDGLGEVYVLNQSRFLADNDQPDQLALTLYGMLAAGMTRDTFVSGEAVSLLPVGTAYYRTMYMPPNLGANSSFLETLKLLLVHERRGPRGSPRGLDLAFSTPRAWLAERRDDRREARAHELRAAFVLVAANRQDDPHRRVEPEGAGAGAPAAAASLGHGGCCACGSERGGCSSTGAR